jgi:arylsulfatase A-like enzyme/Flp pilus assembly protein TadD
LRRPLLFGALPLLLGSCGERAPERLVPSATATNLLLVTLDTMRADRLGAYGSARAHTPVLDRLAREGAIWETAESCVPITLPSHATMFTGLYPFQHGVRNNGFYHLEARFTTLAELLQQAGFDTAAFVGGFPVQAKFGLSQGFALYEDRLPRAEDAAFSHAERPASEVTEAFLRWHAGRKPGGRFFAWLHFFDPHAEYRPPPPYGAAAEGRLYEGEIAFVDAQLGRVLEALDRSGELADTFVLVVGDHGESLGEHGEGTHSVFIYGATLQVPLLLWHRSLAVRGRVAAGLVRTVDLLPTLLELYGLAAPQGQAPSGVPLGPALLRGGRLDLDSYSESLLPSIQFGWGELRGLRRGNLRYIRSIRPELYDLARDPAELRNLHPDPRAEALEEDLAALLASGPAEEAPGAAAQLSASDIEALESLGYVMARAQAASGPVPDVKDRIGLYERLQEGLRLAATGRLAEAAEALERVAAEDPQNVYAKKRLAEVEHRRGRSAEAVALLEPLVRGSVIDSELLAALGRIRRDRSDWEGAARDLTAALRLNPRYATARFDLGQVELRRGRPEEARKLLEQVLAEQPDYVPALVELGNALVAQGAAAEALERYARALELKPDLPGAWLGRGKALGSLGRLDEAREALERAQGLAPEDAVVRRELAEVLYVLGSRMAGTGELEAAYETFRKAVEAAPQDARLWQDLGVVCSRLGRSAEAIADLEKAVALAPGSAVARNSLGVAYGRGGDLERARQAFEEALRLDPAYASAHANLAGVLDALGRGEEAREHEKRAQELEQKR